MTFRCADLGGALRSDDPRQLQAARAHAETCRACRDELEGWDEISRSARRLRREWESPDLWPRIAAVLRDRERAPQRWTWPDWRLTGSGALQGAVAALILMIAAVWFAGRMPWRFAVTDRGSADERLLSEQALSTIERAETDYVRAIDKLAGLAAERIESAPSPLLLAYREKLLVIDTAIADLRAEIDRNPFNSHLRRQLLAMYQEKRSTLEQIMEAPIMEAPIMEAARDVS